MTCDSVPVDSTVNPVPALIARLRAAGCVFAEEEAALLAAEPENTEILEDRVRRRCAGIPLEQILGWSEFYGLRVPVAPGVFVPRRRTELLADRAIAAISQLTRVADAAELTKTGERSGQAGHPRPLVVELCCGSGAVTLAISAHSASPFEAYAVDIHPAAVRCARLNLTGKAAVFEGDLFSPLPHDLRGRVDVVVANAPYIPTAQLNTIPREARNHEPAATHDGGSDGLDVLRRIIAGAPEWLSRDGCLLLECSERQAEAVALVMASHRLVPEIARREATDATVVMAKRQLCTPEPPE